MAFRVLWALSFLIGIHAPPALAGTTWDVAADFSLDGNPNGVWGYGSSDGPDGAFTPFPRSTDASGNLFWTLADGKLFPSVYFTPPSTLVVVSPGDGSVRGVVRFTAPATGAYNLNGRFQRSAPETTADLRITKNGTEPQFLQSLNDGTEFAPFALQVSLSAGDTLEFSVGNAGDGRANDAVPLTAQVVSQFDLPEPKTDFTGDVPAGAGSDLPPVVDTGIVTSAGQRWTVAADGIIDLHTPGPHIRNNAAGTLTEDADAAWAPFTRPGGYPAGSPNPLPTDNPLYAAAPAPDAPMGSLVIGRIDPNDPNKLLNPRQLFFGTTGAGPFTAGFTADFAGKVGLQVNDYYAPENGGAYNVTVGPGPGRFWDAAANYASGANPSSAWSYGWTPALGGALALFTRPRKIGGLDAWTEPAAPDADAALSVRKNTTDSLLTNPSGTAVYPAGKLVLQPGPNGQMSVVRWTSPFEGDATVNAVFHALDSLGTQADVHVLHNGASVFDGEVHSFGSGAALPDKVIRLKTGDTLDFAVGNGGNGNANDSTELSATIVRGSKPAPPPDGAPPNDNIVNAIRLEGRRGFIFGTNRGATWEYTFLAPGKEEPVHGGSRGKRSVWYRWTASESGRVAFTTYPPETDFDTLLGVYLTHGPGLDINDFTDEASGEATGDPKLGPVAQFQAQAGVTYYIAVDGYQKAEGNFTLAWTMPDRIAGDPPPQKVTQLCVEIGCGGDGVLVRAGSSGENGFFLLTVKGTGFAEGAQVTLDGEYLRGGSTQYLGPTELRASIPSGYLLGPADYEVRVRNGNTVSNALPLMVRTMEVIAAPPGGSASGGTPAARGYKLQEAFGAEIANPTTQAAYLAAVRSSREHDTFLALARKARAEGHEALAREYEEIAQVRLTNFHVMWAAFVEDFRAGMTAKVRLTVPETAGAVPEGVPGLALDPARVVLVTLADPLIGNDAGSLIGNDAGSLIGHDGATLIGNDGGSLIGNDAGSLIGNDAGSLITDGGSAFGGTVPQQSGPELVGLVPVLGSGGALPAITNSVNPDGYAIGEVAVTFDETSTPRASELNGGRLFFLFEPLYGDADLSGGVDVQDAILVLRAVVGLSPPTPMQTLHGDVAPKPGAGGNAGRAFGDGALDVQDAVRILRVIVGLETEF